MQRRDAQRVAALIAEHPDRRGWWREATCLGMSCDDFFADEPTVAARAACARCPVFVDCLGDEFGTDPEDVHGYRAGLEAPARRRVLVEAARLLPSKRNERVKRLLAGVAAGVPVTEAAAEQGISRRPRSGGSRRSST